MFCGAIFLIGCLGLIAKIWETSLNFNFGSFLLEWFIGITFEFQVPKLMFHLALFTFSWGFLRLLRIHLKIAINIIFSSWTINIKAADIISIENGPVVEIDENEKKNIADAKKLIKINTSVEETQLSKCAKSVTGNTDLPAICTGTYGEVAAVRWNKQAFQGEGWAITGLKMKYRYVTSNPLSIPDEVANKCPDYILSQETFFQIRAIEGNTFSYQNIVNLNSNEAATV